MLKFNTQGMFSRFELMTINTESAKKFYGEVIVFFMKYQLEV